MFKHLKTVVIVLAIIMLSIITAAIIKNDTTGIIIDVVIHTENGISAEAVEHLNDIPIPQKLGHKFCGWYDNPDLYGESVTALPVRGRISLYPKWEIDVFGVSFDTQGGSLLATVSGKYNSPFLPPEPPLKKGYTFDGWFADVNLTIPYLFNVFGAEDITLYAKWKTTPVTIIFSGAKDCSDKLLQFGEQLGTLPTPTKQGYIFTSWIYEDGSKAESTDFVQNTQEITLYALWEAKTNVLILDANGADGQSVIVRVCTDTEIHLPLNTFERQGFTFGGWAKTPSTEVLYADGDKFLAGTEEINFLYAIWTPVHSLPVLSAKVEDTIYGEPLQIKGITNTTGNDIEYLYKKANSDEYSAHIPTQAGDYHLKMSALSNDGVIISAEYSFTIQKRAINLKAGASVSRSYDGETSADVSIANFIIENVLNNDDIGFSWQTAVFNSPRVEDANKVIIYGLNINNTNYILNTNSIEISGSILPRSAKIYINSCNKTYGDTDPILTYQVENLLAGDTIFASLTREIGENIGIYAINGIFTNPDYNIVFVPNVMVITARSLTLTANNNNKVYGTPDPNLTYTLENDTDGKLPFGDTLLGNLSRTQGEDVGSYAVTIGSLILSNTSNYALTFVGGTLTITPAEAVIDTQNIPNFYDYSGLPHSIFGAVAVGGGRITYLDNSFTAVGDYQITICAESSRNYQSGSKIFTATVLPATLTVTYHGENIVYGNTPALAVTIAGFVGGETATALECVPTIETEFLHVGKHTLTPSNGVADNYIFTYIGGSIFVEPRPLTLIIDSQTKVFGQLDPLFSYNAEGLLEGDELQGILQRDEGESVGEYQIISTLHNPNYNILTISATMTILPNRITVVQNQHGIIYPDNQTDVVYGLPFSITAVPDTGYSVTAFIVDGVTFESNAERSEESIYIFSSVTQSKTITAVFAPNKNILMFDGNGNTSGATATQELFTGESGALAANGFARDGYIFVGWASLPQGNIAYSDGATYTMGNGDSYTLYAQWAAMGRDIDNTGGNGLTAVKSSNTSILFDSQADVSIPLSELGAGYWIAVDIIFPIGSPINQAEIFGDDSLIFIQTSPNNLRIYLDLQSDYIGGEFYFDIKWSEAADTSLFSIHIAETLTLIKLQLLDIEARAIDASILDYSNGILTADDAQIITQIVATFNKNIVLINQDIVFGFEDSGGFSLIINENVATFTAEYTVYQGEYPFWGYLPNGETTTIFPFADETEMLTLDVAALFLLVVNPPPEPLPFGIIDVQATIINNHKSQSYMDAALTISSAASLTFIDIVMSENFVLGTNYSYALFISAFAEVTEFSLVQVGNILRVSFDYPTVFSAGVYELRFRNPRGNAYINIPLSGAESGETFGSQVLITLYAI